MKNHYCTCLRTAFGALMTLSASISFAQTPGTSPILTLSTAGLGISYGLTAELTSHFLPGGLQQNINDYLSNNPQTATQAAAPSVSLQAVPAVVQQGGYVTLSWQSNNAASCVASGGWQGAQIVSGSTVVGPLTENQRFMLSCSGANGGSGALAEAEVQVHNQNGVSVDLQISDATVAPDRSVELTWTSANADYCVASGGWTGPQPVSGAFVTPPLTDSATFQLTCYQGNNSAVAMAAVDIRTSLLAWRAPTSKADGSPLESIGGYNIYWGTAPSNYSDNVRVPPDTTEWWADLLPGTYYFAVSTVDGDGVEGAMSAEVSVQVK